MASCQGSLGTFLRDGPGASLAQPGRTWTPSLLVQAIAAGRDVLMLPCGRIRRGQRTSRYGPITWYPLPHRLDASPPAQKPAQSHRRPEDAWARPRSLPGRGGRRAGSSSGGCRRPVPKKWNTSGKSRKDEPTGWSACGTTGRASLKEDIGQIRRSIPSSRPKKSAKERALALVSATGSFNTMEA